MSQHDDQHQDRADHQCGHAVQRDSGSGAETNGGENAADGTRTTHSARRDADSDDRRAFFAAAHAALPNSVVTIG
jgi:hypothetical protein